MAREIIIDTDTKVGYSFEKSLFYVINKNTTAYRLSAAKAKELLDIVALGNTVTQAQIQDLQDTLETLQALYYTLSDNGSYISTIQLNTYSKNPITIDLKEKKLYIMNTNIIFDLTLNESIEYRLPYIINYYLDTHGLSISYNAMTTIYNKLLSYYNPTVYNEINPPTNTEHRLRYNNKIVCSDYSNNNLITYTITNNPDNTFTTNSLVSIHNNTIELLTVPNPTLQEGDKITVTLDNTTVTYTVQSQSNNIITIKEQALSEYYYTFYTAYAITNTTNITSINRNTKTITLQTNPININVGDTIEITGTTSVTSTVSDTADGSYTVQSITDNTIVVEEDILANYSYSSNGIQAQLFTRTYLSEISKIENNIAQLRTNITITLPQNTTIQIMEGSAAIGSYICTEYTTNTLTLSNCPSYNPEYIPVQIPNMLYNVNTTQSQSPEFPIGEFMLDNFQQVQAYINTYPNITSEYVPTNTNRNNLYTYVPETIIISVDTVTYMSLLGLYSEIYKG